MSIITYIIHPAFFDFIVRPSQRTIYEREFKDRPEALTRWENLFQLALKDDVLIENQLAEHIITSTDKPFTAGYLINIALGETLIAQVNSTDNWILEVRDVQGDHLQDYTSDNGVQTLKYTPESDKKIRLILQAKLKTQSTTDLKVYKAPRYGFPVAGKGNSEIHSFWGARRDGGRRSHEGNDIFAPKRHPVVAITYGRISSIRNRGLGGKQVWVEDYDTGYLHYYAHLDDWSVSEDDMVWTGDTIGYIGNTGNARNTPPHLHFGIYKNGSAVDPKPFIWRTKEPKNSKELPYFDLAMANGFAANLRQQPLGTSEIIRDLKTEPVSIIGNSNDWYHVRTHDGLSGFMHKSVVVKQ